jgi:hypothetical protein
MTKIQPLSNSKITSSLPAVQQYGFSNGANSAAQAALREQMAQNNEQTNLINKHGGGSKSGPLNHSRIVVPQAPEHGMPKISPVGGNSNATNAAGTLTQSVANSQYDNMVGKAPKTGGRKSRKKRRYRRRKTNKRQKPKKKSRKKRTKHRRNHKKRKSRRR